MIVLEIDEPSPSLNRAHGSHWSRKHKLRKRWGWLVKAALNAAGFWERPKWKRAKVTVERYGARLLDDENLRAGFKPALDALVKEGILLDDNPNVIGSPQFHQIIGKERRTVVRIEPL